MKIDINVDYLPVRPSSSVASPSNYRLPPINNKRVRPKSGLNVAVSPNKSNNIHNLSEKYVKRVYQQIGAYYVDKCLGAGSFGKVYKVYSNKGQVYALKKIPIFRNMTRYDANCIITEVKVASSHNCKYLLSAKDVFVANGNICIVTDYAEKGDLSNILKQKRYAREHLEEGLIWDYLLQLLIAVEYMHSFNIIHRDIKSLNVFLTAQNNILLGDFGISKILRSSTFGTSTQIGTPLYASPEMVLRQKYDTKIDIWSLGCLVWEMMSLEPAFNAHNAHLLNHRILKGLCSSSIPPGRYSRDLVSLAKKMINTDPSRRPNIHEIMALPMIRMRLESSGCVTNDLSDYTMTNKLKRNIYPPSRPNDWERVCEELNKTMLFSGEKELQRSRYKPTIHYTPSVQIQRRVRVNRFRDPKALPPLPKPTIPPWAPHY